MSVQRVQGVLLFLVRFNNSARFEIYGVTRSSSSRPFLCVLGDNYQGFIQEFFLERGNIDASNGCMPVLVHLLGFCRFEKNFWAYLRTRNVRCDSATVH